MLQSGYFPYLFPVVAISERDSECNDGLDIIHAWVAGHIDFDQNVWDDSAI